MGNECGYGCTFEESLKWTKEFDPTRLTTYESAFYQSTEDVYKRQGEKHVLCFLHKKITSFSFFAHNRR